MTTHEERAKDLCHEPAGHGAVTPCPYHDDIAQSLKDVETATARRCAEIAMLKEINLDTTVCIDETCAVGPTIATAIRKEFKLGDNHGDT